MVLHRWLPFTPFCILSRFSLEIASSETVVSVLICRVSRYKLRVAQMEPKAGCVKPIIAS